MLNEVKSRYAGKKISVSLGILLIVFTGCKSDSSEQKEFDTQGFFKEMEEVAAIKDKNFLDLEGNWRFSIGDDTPGFTRF